MIGAGRLEGRKAYWHLVHELPELYCLAFALLDCEFTRCRGSYMQFNEIAARVRRQLGRALGDRAEGGAAPSVASLRARLLPPAIAAQQPRRQLSSPAPPGAEAAASATSSSSGSSSSVSVGSDAPPRSRLPSHVLLAPAVPELAPAPSHHDLAPAGSGERRRQRPVGQQAEVWSLEPAPRPLKADLALMMMGAEELHRHSASLGLSPSPRHGPGARAGHGPGARAGHGSASASAAADADDDDDAPSPGFVIGFSMAVRPPGPALCPALCPALAGWLAGCGRCESDVCAPG
jgi:hypothetical protein